MKAIKASSKMVSGASRKMVYGILFLATIFFFSWGMIKVTETLGTVAMTSASTKTAVATNSTTAAMAVNNSTTITTTATTKEAATAMPAMPKRVFCLGDSLTAGTSRKKGGFFPYAPYLEKALNDHGEDTTATNNITVEWKGFPGWTSFMIRGKLEKEGLKDFVEKEKEQDESNTNNNNNNNNNTKHEENLPPPPPFDLAIILVGTNDVFRKHPNPENIFNSIRKLHELVLDKGSCTKTLALGIPPSGWGRKPERGRVAAAVNQQLETWFMTTGTSTSTNSTSNSSSNSSSSYYTPFPISTYDPSSNLFAEDGIHFTPEGYEYLANALAPIVTEILSTTND